MEQCLAGLKTAISGLQGEVRVSGLLLQFTCTFRTITPMLRNAQDYAAAVRSVQTLGGEVVRVSATCLPDVLVCTSVRSQTYQVRFLQAFYLPWHVCAGCALLQDRHQAAQPAGSACKQGWDACAASCLAGGLHSKRLPGAYTAVETCRQCVCFSIKVS